VKKPRFALAILSLAMLACLVPVGNSLPTKAPQTETALAISTETATPLPTQASALAIVTATRSLNVRERAGNDQRVIGVLFSGDTVQLTGVCSTDRKGWAQIKWKDGTAYVSAKYLSDNQCEE